MTKLRKNIIKIYVITLSLGLAYYIWLELTGLYIPCLVVATTGMKCCGCGITRMFVSMAQLDFGAAFNYNPVMFIAFFFWNMVAAMVFWGKLRFVSSKIFLYAALGITVAVFCVFWFVRNL